MNPLESVQNEEAVVPGLNNDEASFGDVLRQFEEEHQAGGGALEGVVMSLGENGAVVDIGRKREGILPPELAQGLTPGTKVVVNISGSTDEGYYRLSTIHVERPVDYSGIQAAFEAKQVVAGTATELVKGGVRVDVGAPAFMPASRTGIREMAELGTLIGQEVRVRITKFDVTNPERPDIVVDRRAVLEEETAKAREAAFAQVQEGSVLAGRVRSLTEFGAFVELLPGVDGLLHVTDMSWSRVDKPASLLSIGQDLQVKVLKVNAQSRKISLGLKQLTPDPWTQTLETLKVGDRVRGKVVRMADFGAFVELAPGVDGLIHLSELSWTRRVKKPSDVLQLGEEVEAVVLAIQPAEKRIGLGLKQALGNPWDDAAERFPAGSVVEGPVTNLAQFGAFVDLGNGIEGMIHIGDIVRDRRLQHPKEALTPGQVVKAVVLDVERDKKRIRLGMKQLEPTSADLFIKDHQPGEVVTGRIVEAHRDHAKVEVGDGVHARCHYKETAKEEKKSQAAAATEVDDLAALLKKSWSGGGFKAPEDSPNQLKPGQIRKFRIVSTDAANKRIDVELAD